MGGEVGGRGLYNMIGIGGENMEVMVGRRMRKDMEVDGGREKEGGVDGEVGGEEDVVG